MRSTKIGSNCRLQTADTRFKPKWKFWAGLCSCGRKTPIVACDGSASTTTKANDYTRTGHEFPEPTKSPLPTPIPFITEQGVESSNKPPGHPLGTWCGVEGNPQWFPRNADPGYPSVVCGTMDDGDKDTMELSDEVSTHNKPTSPGSTLADWRSGASRSDSADTDSQDMTTNVNEISRAKGLLREKLETFPLELLNDQAEKQYSKISAIQSLSGVIEDDEDLEQSVANLNEDHQVDRFPNNASVSCGRSESLEAQRIHIKGVDGNQQVRQEGHRSTFKAYFLSSVCCGVKASQTDSHPTKTWKNKCKPSENPTFRSEPVIIITPGSPVEELSLPGSCYSLCTTPLSSISLKAVASYETLVSSPNSSVIMRVHSEDDCEIEELFDEVVLKVNQPESTPSKSCVFKQELPPLPPIKKGPKVIGTYLSSILNPLVPHPCQISPSLPPRRLKALPNYHGIKELVDERIRAVGHIESLPELAVTDYKRLSDENVTREITAEGKDPFEKYLLENKEAEGSYISVCNVSSYSEDPDPSPRPSQLEVLSETYEDKTGVNHVLSAVAMSSCDISDSLVAFYMDHKTEIGSHSDN